MDEHLRRGIRLLLALLAGGVLAFAACGQVQDETTGPALQDTQPAAPAAQGPTVLPARIDVDAIDAPSTLIPLGTDPDGSPAEPPVEQPQQASWYKYSVVAGQPGPSVILGHINGGKHPGVFVKLGELAVGDLATVTLTDGTSVTYSIKRTQKIDKLKFPTDQVFARSTTPKIVLVSCGGRYDPDDKRYLDSIIAYGDQVT
jgi:sortase (surface protein transpeptidase)